MTVLHRLRWRRLLLLQLFVLFIIIPQRQTMAQAQVLDTLVMDSCLQQCFIQISPNLDVPTVCNNAGTAPQCAATDCPDNKSAGQSLINECSSLGFKIASTAPVVASATASPAPTTKSASAPEEQSIATASPASKTTAGLVTLQTGTTPASASTTHPPTENAEPIGTTILPPTTGTLPIDTPLPTPIQTSANATPPPSKQRTSSGVIAAAVVAPLSGIALAGLGGFYFLRRRRQKSRRMTIRSFMDFQGPQEDPGGITGPLAVRNPDAPSPRTPPPTLKMAEAAAVAAGGVPVSEVDPKMFQMMYPAVYKEGETPLTADVPFRTKALPPPPPGFQPAVIAGAVAPPPTVRNSFAQLSTISERSSLPEQEAAAAAAAGMVETADTETAMKNAYRDAMRATAMMFPAPPRPSESSSDDLSSTYSTDWEKSTIGQVSRSQSQRTMASARTMASQRMGIPEK